MPAYDPTIPDRLILRALIEDGLPSKAAHENWPIRQPWEFARAIFDCVYRCPYEEKLVERLKEYAREEAIEGSGGNVVELKKPGERDDGPPSMPSFTF